MECAFLVDESPCGDVATPYSSLPLCDLHIERLRTMFSSRSRLSAIQSAKHHPLEAFPGWCYIVLLPDGNVKIGYSNTDELLDGRVKSLGKQYKAPVVLLGKIRGGFVAEAVLHHKFKDYRLPGTGERFTYSPEMAEYIASLP